MCLSVCPRGWVLPCDHYALALTIERLLSGPRTPRLWTPPSPSLEDPSPPVMTSVVWFWNTYGAGGTHTTGIISCTWKRALLIDINVLKSSVTVSAAYNEHVTVQGSPSPAVSPSRNEIWGHPPPPDSWPQFPRLVISDGHHWRPIQTCLFGPHWTGPSPWLVLTSGGHRSTWGWQCVRHASYWNAFLFQKSICNYYRHPRIHEQIVISRATRMITKVH